MLEHWVAVGLPQIVTGRLEARIEQQGLVEIRHHATTSVTLTLDMPQSNDPFSLQSLMCTWHTQQLGIQTLSGPLKVLILRSSRFERSGGTIKKVNAPVQVSTVLQVPVFDNDTLQCSYTRYHVLSVIMHSGPTPNAGHYTARLFRTGDQQIALWSTDDARPAKLVHRDTAHDHHLSP